MRSLGERLAARLERTVTGPMWHGPALDEVLADITPAQAAARPITGAHTIWELVLHIAVWADIARARLESPVGDPAPERDWPTPIATGPAEWRAAVARLRESYQTLAASVRGLDDTGLAALVAGQQYSASTMLHGVVEHGAYHGGQIALLRRALSRSR
jgi:uncharacterized damage-inducible protein DinB